MSILFFFCKHITILECHGAYNISKSDKKQLHAESGPRNAAKSVIKNSRYLQAFLTPCLGSKLD
jgi:hypothetical protein